MWVRRRLDIQWSDLAFGFWRCAFPGENRRAAIELTWSGDAHALACLSVRTGFDLCLQALGLPKGSEILMSAVNVPAMFRLVEEHGLVPVPLDIDSEALRPTLADVRHAITPRTRAIVVAHLFGTRADLDDIAALARGCGVVMIEDHAQAFCGVPETAPSADIAFWSFGPIKAATALGGAIAVVHDVRLAERMRAIESAYRVQPWTYYVLRLLKYATLKAASYRFPFGVLVRALSWAGDYDAWLNARVRSFEDAGLVRALRHRPRGSLFAVLERRLRDHDGAEAARRRRRGLDFEEMIRGYARVPGAAAAWRGFDLFPVRVANTARLLAALRRRGFDAGTRGNLVVLDAENGVDPASARELLENTVFIPFYAAMPDRELRRLAHVIKDAVAAAPTSADQGRADGSCPHAGPTT